MSLRPAQVVAVHPERRTVDLVMLDDGSRIAEAMVASPSAYSDGGSWSVPDVPKPDFEEDSGRIHPSGRAMIALCGVIESHVVVLGFLPADGSQMYFTEQNRQVHRHPSGSYATIAPDGSVEVSHPSGAYIRLGSGEHQDLGPLAADGNWSVAALPWPQITVVTKDVTLTMADGEVVLTATRRIRLTAGRTTLELRDDGSSWTSPDIEVTKA